MKEAWKALLRAIRDLLRWIARLALKPLVKALKAIGELCVEWSQELEKI